MDRLGHFLAIDPFRLDVAIAKNHEESSRIQISPMNSFDKEKFKCVRHLLGIAINYITPITIINHYLQPLVHHYLPII